MVMCHNRSTLHIVLASNDARHISPFFCLATAISHFGHHVSLVSSPSNIKAITAGTSVVNPANLDLVPLQGDNRTDFKVSFKEFLLQATKDVDWVLYDNSTFWVPEISKRLGIHSAYVLSTSVVTSLFLWPALCKPDFSEIDQRMEQAARSPTDPYPCEDSMVLDHLLSRDAEDLQLYYRIHKAFTTCDVVASPSYYELDRAFLLNLKNICKKEVVCFGHLVPTATNVVDKDNHFLNSITVKEWLDKRGQRSVVYVAFEPETCIITQQVHAIICALDNSHFPFIWVTGNPQGCQTIHLPQRFVDSTINRGLVCKHWVPHADILGHPSIGGFLTNGGWSLCAESLNFGVPLILTPFTTAEMHNAHLLQKKGLGYEIKKSRRFGGAILVSDVRNALEHVMADEDGGNIRECANGVRGVFDTLQHSYLMRFLDHLAKTKMKTTKKKKNAVSTAKEKMKNVIDITGEDGVNASSYVCKFYGCVMCKGKRKVAAGIGTST